VVTSAERQRFDRFRLIKWKRYEANGGVEEREAREEKGLVREK
jgi:hypothetical protein